MNKEQKKELSNWFNCFQNGVMTYFHLFTTVSRNDRFNIGEMCSTLCEQAKATLKSYPEAISLMEAVSDELCELDSCDPTKIPDDCEYQDHFMVIFDAIGQVRRIANIQYDFYVDNDDDEDNG